MCKLLTELDVTLPTFRELFVQLREDLQEFKRFISTPTYLANE